MGVRARGAVPRTAEQGRAYARLSAWESLYALTGLFADGAALLATAVACENRLRKHQVGVEDRKFRRVSRPPAP